MPLQEGEVQSGLEVSLDRQVEAGEKEERGVEGEEERRRGRDEGRLSPRRSGEQEERTERVDDADARQDARDPQVEEPVEGKREGGERPADEDDRRAPAEGVPGQLGGGGPKRGPLAQREDRRRPDDEEKERKDEVCRRAAVPLCVSERRQDEGPASRVVDEEHGGDRHPPEEVEGGQPAGGRMDSCL